MHIERSDLEALFESVCNPLRHRVVESNAAVVRKANQQLAFNSADARARHVVAASALIQGRANRTRELLLAAPQGLGQDATGAKLVAYASLRLGEIESAQHWFSQVIQLDPNHTDCWDWLGRICTKNDDLDRARLYYEQGVHFDDHRHLSSVGLSRVLQRRGQLTDAIQVLRVALIHDRRSAVLNRALARLLDRQAVLLGRRRRSVVQQRVREEALECYRVVNSAAPRPESLVMQGRLEQQLGNHESARLSFARAVKLAPRSAGALCQLASANVDIGELDVAIKQFEQSIAIDPSRAETHFRYTRSKRFNPGAESASYLDRLNAQLSDASQANQRQKLIYLHFSIAKVLDDTKQYDRAWHHYDQANRLKAVNGQSSVEPTRTTHLRPKSIRPFVTNAKEQFSAEFMRHSTGVGIETDLPIFIVGMPRSGTTLTEQILCSHPDVAGAGELPSMNQIRQSLFQYNAIGPNLGEGIAEGRRWSMDELSQLRQYAKDYVDQLAGFCHGENHVTDKMPTNFMHLGMIAVMFPGATVIHCRRNPMDILASCYCQNLNAPFCDLDQLVEYHRQYRRLMRHWEQVLPIQIHNSDYESLVTHPEQQARKLINHCHLEWDDQCLKFAENRRAVHTPSKWQVRQPIFRQSVEKWRRFEKYLAPYAEQIAAEMESETAGEGVVESRSLCEHPPILAI